MKHSSQRRKLVLSAALGALVSPIAWAQKPKFPNRVVKMVVPSTPGGGPDFVGRLVAQMLSVKWGQSIIVENLAGASMQLGTNSVVKAMPDGHTVLFTPPTPITIANFFEPKPPYEVNKDLVTAGLMGRNPALIVINSQVKANTMKEFIALAKKEKLFYASPGQGHAFQLTTEIICTKAGIHMTHVPYKGSSPAVMGLIGGEVQFLVQSTEAVKEHIKSGRLRALATLENTRLEAFPDAPTLAESGLENLGIMNWYGLFMPIATPKDILEFWESELQALSKDPGFRKKMFDMSFDPVFYGTQDFLSIMQKERMQWRDVIASTQVQTKKE